MELVTCGLILAVHEGDCLALCLGRFIRGKTATGWTWWPEWDALEKRKNLLSLSRIESRIVDRLTRKEVTKSTELLMAGNGMFFCRRLSK